MVTHRYLSCCCRFSMPPRRSCFGGMTEADFAGSFCFNATTAFLLLRPGEALQIFTFKFQCHHGVPASIDTSRKPKGRKRFQCHHGVPASQWKPAVPRRWSWVSMPPRRSCFSPQGDVEPDRRHVFQCHHGVPASSSLGSVRAWMIRFQCHHGVPASTTASNPTLLRSHVSMPPRRSCFEGLGLLQLRILAFQCHHGVPASSRNGCWSALISSVSMPPRRSCFASPPPPARWW